MSNKTVSKEQRDELRKAAMEATEGDWFVEAQNENSCFYSSVVTNKCDVATTGAYPKSRENAKKLALENRNAIYIAKVQPKVVLALLDMIDRLEVEGMVGREREGWCEEE